MLTGTRSEGLAWRLALASFTVAALTGAFMRFGLYLGFPAWLRFGDVRHAHSHLMFFAWATPALILCAHRALKNAGRRLPGGVMTAIVAALAGLLAYVPFLLSGYGFLRIGDAGLPVSMMASGLNGIVWYAFAALYFYGARGVVRTPALRLMDGAVVMLVVSTVGILLLMVDGMSGTATASSVAASAEFYTNVFADGWFGLGLLAGLALAGLLGRSGGHGAGSGRLGFATWSLVVGLTARSGARLLAHSAPEASLRLVGGLGGLVAAAAWLWLVASLWRLWRARPVDGETDDTVRTVALAALALVGLKAVVEVALSLPAGEAFVASEGLRVLLLHAFLLGAVTLGLAATGRALLGRAAWTGLGAFGVSVALMILLLVPLTGVWPASLAGPWTLRAAAFSSLGPALLGGYALLFTARRHGPGSTRR